MLISAAERRALISGDSHTQVRISDLSAVIPAITGKVEMVYEGEMEGPLKVAQNLIGKAIKNTFAENCPPLEKFKKKGNDSTNPYKHIMNWFDDGKHLDIAVTASNGDFEKTLNGVTALREFADQHFSKHKADDQLLLMELVLFGLSENSKLSRATIDKHITFKDLLGSMFTGFTDNSNV
jgi:magnesium chelatase subunit I